jgi:hypothetical protein
MKYGHSIAYLMNTPGYTYMCLSFTHVMIVMIAHAMETVILIYNIAVLAFFSDSVRQSHSVQGM